MNPARKISPALDADDAIEAALDAESARGNREFATYRFAGLTVFLALMTTFRLLIPGWIGPLPSIAVYWAVTGVVWVFSRRSDAAARATSLAIPLVDMPALTLVLLRTMSLLRQAGYPAHAQGLRLSGAAFALIFVVGTLPGLSVLHVYLATATAVVCEALLILSYEPDLTLAAVMSIVIGMVGLIAASVTKRTRSLVRSTAADEVRRRRLQRYFPAQVVEHVEGATDRLSAGESREVSVLFCDIRGFTRLSEPLPSESVVELLNDFHGCMADVIFEHGGTLDKFMGDGLMSYFGAPVLQPDHALRALRCGIAMQSRLDALNRDRQATGKPPLSMGVGIHSGRVVLGDIGSAQRRDFTIVGDAVNVASRIERLTRTLDRPILISSETRHLAGNTIALAETDPVAVPGRSGKLVCYYPV
jgi:adenylate cyclase